MKYVRLRPTGLGVLLSAALGLFTTPLLAVDNLGVFELDGNALQDDPTPPPDDWETLESGGNLSYTRIVDKNGTDNIFTGGGSKTPNDPGQWLWKSSPPPPDKDNITNAYAVNYIHNGKQIVYFGADLFATNGDAELAFWFFQDAVSPNAGGGFDGHHVDEDVYVAVKFSNGGTLATITVFEWWAACNKADKDPTIAGACAADNIRVLIPASNALCSGAGGIACAITNLANTPSPWPYVPKSGTSGIFPETSFFEGGINIFDVFGANKCFASYMASTGASTSFTATAKDFALGDFNVCSVAVSKTCVNDSEDDDAPSSITYNVRGCGYNDGTGSINVTGLSNSIGGGAQYTPSDLAWFEPGQVDDGGGLRDFNAATDCGDADLLDQAVLNGLLVADPSTVDLGGGEALVYDFTETTSVNGPSDTVTLEAEGVDGTPINDDTASATCPQRTFAASLAVTKQCAADLEDAGSNLVVVIDIQGQVCNTGEVELTGLSLSDSVAGGTVTLVPDSTTLAPAGETGDCTSYAGYYYPSSIPTGNVCPFMDQVTATAIAPVNSAGDGCTLLGNGTSECTADSNSATCELRALDEDNDCSTGPLAPTL